MTIKDHQFIAEKKLYPAQEPATAAAGSATVTVSESAGAASASESAVLRRRQGRNAAAQVVAPLALPTSESDCLYHVGCSTHLFSGLSTRLQPPLAT